MDLPTYTNIWRIEKRLYKLYDLRLPMPLPLVQIGVFVGVFLPWILLLKFVGIPFRTPWHVLYLVPPGVLTWLATRPVIEGKRLTELLLSQTRYVTEPRTWCRLTPIREPREVVVVARVWRQNGTVPQSVTAAGRAASRGGRKAREAQAKGRGRHAAQKAPAPARAAAAHTAGAALASYAANRPAQSAAPQPLEEYAAAQAAASGHAGADGRAVVPPAFGAEVRGVEAPRAGGMPATGEHVASPPARRGDSRRAASAWRPKTRRNISHEPEPAAAATPTPGAVSGEHTAHVEPPPATPRLEAPPVLERPVVDETGRPGPAETERPASPEAVNPAATGGSAERSVGAAPAPDRPGDSRGGQAGAPPPVGSGKRGLASGVRRPGAAAEFWKAIAPPAQPEPEQSRAEQVQEPQQAKEPERPGKAEQAEGTAPINATETAKGAEQREEPDSGRGEAASGSDTTTPDEQPASPPPAVTRPDTPQVRPTPTTRPDIPAVPGAFGTSGFAAAEPATGDTTAGTEETSGEAAARPAVEERTGEAAARAAEPTAEQPAAAAPAAEESRDRAKDAKKPPPRPWSEGLSRPLRETSADALVWPPPQIRPADGRPQQRKGAPPRRPGEQGPSRGGPTRAPGSTGAPAQQQPRKGPSPKVHGFAAASPGDRDDAPPEGTPPAARPPAQPYGHQQPPGRGAQTGPQTSPQTGPRTGPQTSPHGIPMRPPQPVGPEAPATHGRVGTPDARPGAQPEAAPEAYAPAREVRSGPTSPVRPRPLPPPPSPPSPSQSQAITPPDPEHEGTAGGLRRLIQAVGGGHSQVDSEYEERLQRPFHGTRHIVVLGCTGGAGQTVTALMLGHTFAQYCGEPIVAIDVNPGPGALARRTRSETNETLTGLITRADQVNTLTAMRRYTSQAKSGLDVITAGKNPLQALDDRDYALAIRTIDRFYSVTMLDAAAAVVARVLPYADQIVLVAPASADAPRAVAMTFEWLDGHGYDELRSHAVTVINGVSRRSMDDVEQAESVARGRCRALVRIPWDDHLSLDRSPRNELKSLRAPTRRAYLALAGVVAGGFVALPERYQQQEASR